MSGPVLAEAWNTPQSSEIREAAQGGKKKEKAQSIRGGPRGWRSQPGERGEKQGCDGQGSKQRGTAFGCKGDRRYSARAWERADVLVKKEKKKKARCVHTEKKYGRNLIPLRLLAESSNQILKKY